MKIEFWFIDNKASWREYMTWFSWIIQLFSWWNHLAIRIITDREDYFIHAQLRVVRQEYTEFVKAADRTVLVMVPILDMSHRIAWLHAQLGKLYDVPAIFLQLIYQFTGWWLWLDLKLNRLWFCSEIGAAFLRLPEAHKYSPQAVAESGKLRYDRVLMTKKGIGVVVHKKDLIEA